MDFLDTLKNVAGTVTKSVLGPVGGSIVNAGAKALSSLANTQAKSAASMSNTAPTTKPSEPLTYKGEPTSSYATGKPIGQTPVSNISSGVSTQSGAKATAPTSNNTAFVAPKAPAPAPAPAPTPVNTQISGSNPFGNSNYTPTFSSPSPAFTAPTAPVNNTPPPVASGTVIAPPPTQQPSVNPELEQLRAALLGTYQQTPEERQAQEALQRLAQQQADLSGAFRSGTNKIGEQPIVLSLLRGQQQALQKQYEGQVGALADQAKPLEVQLANLIANRDLQNKALTTQYGFASEEQQRQDALAQAAAEKSAGFTLGEGQQRFDAQGNLIASGGDKKTSIPASIQEYQFAQEQGFNGSYLDYVKAKEQATGGGGSTPSSYKEWELAGRPGTYADWVKTSSGKAPTASQFSAAGFANRIADTSNTFDQLANEFSKVTAVGGILPNFLKSENRQVFEQAERNFINATLRRESGAAIADSEFNNARQQYIPQPGDSAGVLESKRQNRLRIQQQLSAEGAGALEQMGGTQSQNIYGNDPLGAILSGLNFKNAPSKALNGSQIGSLSAKYESGGSPGAIGYDKTGGYSYGTYQLAHNNAQRFVAESPYAKQFAGIPFNSAQFQQKWKEIAAKDPQGFATAQHDYIAKTHYEPVINRISSMGVDPNKLSQTVKDVIWSTAVQHGPGSKIVDQAIASARDEKDLIQKIYQLRWNNGSGFASSTPAVRQSVYNRFFGPSGELNTALSRLA